MSVETVEQIVARTRALHWWIDRQVQRGYDDDQIAALLPLAHAVITGRVTLVEVTDAIEDARGWRSARRVGEEE